MAIRRHAGPGPINTQGGPQWILKSRNNINQTHLDKHLVVVVVVWLMSCDLIDEIYYYFDAFDKK